MEYIKKQVAERDSLATQIVSMAEAAAQEDRSLTDSENGSIDRMKAEVDRLDAELRRWSDVQKAVTNFTPIGDAVAEKAAKAKDPEPELRSMGDAFTASEVYNNYPGRGTSSRMTFETRALPSTLTTMAAGLPPKMRFDLSAAPYPTPLLDLIDTVPVSGNGVETIVWALTGAAAVVGEGLAKPSAELAPTVASFTLDTIAVWTQATRQLLEDAPAIAAKINTELARAVSKKMETEAAAALVAATIPTATDTVSLTNAIRKGVGIVQAAGYDPNAVLLNPADWARLDIDVFGSTLLGPTMTRTFWGLQPVAANSQPAGTATVGDFSAGVQRYARNGISLYVTDSDQDDFIKNLFKILAEARAKTVVTRPAALVEVSSAGAFAAAAQNPAASRSSKSAEESKK